jgi:tRNA-dihydrouridine synthase B
MKVRDFEARIREARLMLPPLADYTDYPYRRVIAGYDPPFVVTEMISADALIHGGTKTRRMLERVSGARCEGVQLVGADPDSMAEAARMVEGLGFDYVDINMGCTINKVARQGAGISLMGDEDRACGVASAIIDVVRIPVTCKMRLGVNRSNINAVSLSKRLEGLGVAAIAVHGRSGEKKWGLPIDYEGIRGVVEALGIPVVANGGIFTGEDAKKMIERTGAAGVMPGRGLIGNPWIALEITAALTGADYYPPTLAERKETCLLHMRYFCEYYGDKGGAVRMRRILPKYFPGCKNLRSLRYDIHTASSPGEVAALMDRILEDGAHGCYDGRVTLSEGDPSPKQG